MSCLTPGDMGVGTNDFNTYWTVPSISADGTRVVFISTATNITTPASNGNRNAFLWDETGGISLITTGASGIGGNDYTSGADISPDGASVGVASYATDLVAGLVTNSSQNVFLYDLASGAAELISEGASGDGGDEFSYRPSTITLGPNGLLAFHSYASDLTSDGVATNNTYQNIFIWARISVHTVTYDAQNGTTPTTREVIWGDSAPMIANPTRAGYKFTGWWTAPTGGALWDFATPLTGDITLYGQWVVDSLPPAGDSLSLLPLACAMLLGGSALAVAPTLKRKER
jgi:uncharacterized repeat protein (TIGR02543 family)